MIWLWDSSSGTAAVCRGLLVPLSAVYRGAVTARAAAYTHGWVHRTRLPAPSIAVGSLQVGGAGKTPLASWIAGHLQQKGRRPAVLLRDYGGDEAQLHREAVPGAIVEIGADRHAAGQRAVIRGADVLVLDDAFQRLDVRPTLNLALVSAERVAGSRWTLPAGPWREGWAALGRADAVIVTVKSAPDDVVSGLVGRLRATGHPPTAIAQLEPLALHGLRTGVRLSLNALRGARVLVSAGIADPDALARQIERVAARVSLLAWRDHHPFGPAEITRIVRVQRKVDYVVITAKDAVKLRRLWPPDEPEPLVAELALFWRSGRPAFERLLDTAVQHSGPGIRERQRSWMRVA